MSTEQINVSVRQQFAEALAAGLSEGRTFISAGSVLRVLEKIEFAVIPRESPALNVMFNIELRSENLVLTAAEELNDLFKQLGEQLGDHESMEWRRKRKKKGASS